MRLAKASWLALSAVMAAGPAPFAAASGDGCSVVTEYYNNGAGTENVSADGVQLAATSSKICGVHFLASAANGQCGVFESVDGTSTHAQNRRICEPGAATSGNADHCWFGESGYETQMGVAVDVRNGRCVIHWRP